MTQAVKRKRQSGYADHPGYEVSFAPSPKRVRVTFAGETIADSMNALLLRETRHVPVYYFPRADVRMERLTRTAHETFCPFKGEASYWTLEVGGRRAENAVWSYETPFPEVAGIRDYLGFYWSRMDSWWEEDEEVFVHARDPHVRVDVLQSRRRVRVTLAGETLADTTRALFLFETGHPVRYYVPPADVRMELLRDSDRATACPYKGAARYWSAAVGDRLVEDVAWAYPEPLPEVGRIADHLCFYPDKVDAIAVESPAPARATSRVR
jgi:uncharacterized protein (DUF427 family)